LKGLRSKGILITTFSVFFLLLYLWIRYFSPRFPSSFLGICAFLGLWAGGYLWLQELIPRRYRLPARFLRWNALVAVLGLTHVLLWGVILGLFKPEAAPTTPAAERLISLLTAILDGGILLQAAVHFILASHLISTRPTPQKRWSLIGFFALAALILFLQAGRVPFSSYLTPVLWIGTFPLLYYSQWLQDITQKSLWENLLLIIAAFVALFIGWEVFPSLLLPEVGPLYEVLYPILLTGIFLHGGWVIVPLLLRVARIAAPEEGSLELLTDFLAQQQRATTTQEVLQTAQQAFLQVPAVGGVVIELRTPLEKSLRFSSYATDSAIGQELLALLHAKSGGDPSAEVVVSLQKRRKDLPDHSALLVVRPVSLLQGAALYRTLSVAIESREPDGFEEKDITLLSTLVEQTALFLESIERRSYQEQLLTARKEADFLRETREALLPPPPPILNKVDFHILFEQYDKTIGGDYYQIHEYPQGNIVDFWLSDCAGSGIAAAYQMAQARGALNTLWLRQLPPETLLLELNDALKRVFYKNNFIAATLLRFDLERKEYTLLRAGTPEVFYWNPFTQTAEILRPSGIVLGNASSSIINRILVPERGKLLPGSLFMLFSDGFTEASNAQGEMFSTETLFSLFQRYAALPVEEMALRILEAVRHFVGDTSLGDDGTLLVIRYTG
jgi:serine phosphatase RsbU (regulator of sigma subunit)